MGVVNVTPDSFSEDGCLHVSAGRARFDKNDFIRRAVRLALRQEREGADLIDIGGESSRPGARPVSAKEEIRRVVPVIAALRRRSQLPISIDTYKPLVARHALDAGAAIVNDILGVHPDRGLLRMVRDYDAGIILMHIRGTPRVMQRRILHGNIVADIVASLQSSLEICLEIGIKSDRIMLDPGVGFGKSVEQNLLVINKLPELAKLGFPILIGTSRKSFIGAILEKDVHHRLWGTAATVAAGIMRGAHVVRVHDVAAMRDVVRMTDAIVAGERMIPAGCNPSRKRSKKA